MIIKDSTLQALRTMVRSEYSQAFNAAINRDDYKELVTIITSSQTRMRGSARFRRCANGLATASLTT